MQSANLKLTIIMAAYNKANWIKRALDSIRFQKTSFSYQVIIIDDYSQDNTVDIVNSYIKDNPEMDIKFIKNNVNFGYLNTIFRGYEETKTLFWTILDPDDYWTSPDKIQRAIDFLDNHPDHTIYATNAEIKTTEGTKLGETTLAETGASFALDIDNQSYTHTSATFFRNCFDKNDILKLKIFKGSPYQAAIEGNTFRNFWHLNHGKGFFENRIESVYEVDGKGLYSGKTAIEREALNLKIHYFSMLFFKKKHTNKFIHEIDICLNNILENPEFDLLPSEDKNYILQIETRTERYKKNKKNNMKIYCFYLFDFIYILKKIEKHRFVQFKLFGFLTTLVCNKF